VTGALRDDGPLVGTSGHLGDEVPLDGRRARRHRSRDLAVEALLDLLNEGVLRPTAQQVAERSGVSLRSIFRIFDDVQSLHEAATARHLSRVGHLFVAIDAHGTLEQRLEAVLHAITELYEAVAPVRRAALRIAPESEVVQHRTAQARSWLRNQLDRVFAPEFAASLSPEHAAAAVEAMLSFEAWDQLRIGQGLDPAAATDVLRHAARALLA